MILLGVNIKIAIVTLDQLVISIILLLIKHEANLITLSIFEGRRGRDCMVAGFTTTRTISDFHLLSCHKVCLWLSAGRWFSPGTPVSSTKYIWPPRVYWNILQRCVKLFNPKTPMLVILFRHFVFSAPKN